MDAIALYDDGISAQEPLRGPTIFMPEAGDAVFRGDWSEEATYMLLRGEHGRAREQGLGHEHADETSFLIYAAGEMLALDAGYINFSNHLKVNAGRNHNLILVDGEGPPLDFLLGESIDGGNDAFIERFFTGDSLDYAEVAAAYENVDFRRRVMFVGKEYFVISDQVRDGVSHQYEWRLHGHGGGTSGGTYARSDNLARWTRPQAELIAFMPPADGRTFAESDTIHSFDFLEEPTHTLLQVRETGSDVDYLAVLYPRALSVAEPVFTAPAASGGEAVAIAREGVVDYTWSADAGSDSVQVTTVFGTLTSDANFGFARFADSTLTALTMIGGTLLAVDGAQLFSASNSTDMSLVFGTGSVTGFLREGGAGTIATLALGDSVESVDFAGTLTSSNFANSTHTLQFTGAGPITVTTSNPNLIPSPFAAGAALPMTPDVGEVPTSSASSADFDGNGAVDFQDFFLFADAFGQEAGGELAKFDLDGSGAVDFQDFFLFADQFGN